MLRNVKWMLVIGWTLGGVAVARDEAGPLEQHRVEAAAAYSFQHGGHALLIEQGGRTLLEKYSGGHSASSKHRIYSGTKGFWGLAALNAGEKGIFDLDDRVSKHLPEWKDDPRKDHASIDELLLFNSGLEAKNLIHEDNLKNRDQMAIDAAMVASPGRAFIYGPAALQVFHEILKRHLVRKGERPHTFLEKEVLSPMGLGRQRYIPDKAGNPLLAAGFMMTARQWSHLGDVLTAEGRPILSDPDSFERITRGSSANRAYSFGFWNNRAAGDRRAREIDVEEELSRDWWKQNWSHACLCKDAPTDLLACIGSNSQRLYAVPSLKVVIVRQGVDRGFSDAEFLRLVFHQ